MWLELALLYLGCDGGTIPRRDELVKTKKKPEQKDKSSELSFRWQHCTITQQPLQSPIVACELGRLYSKESVLEALLDKSEGSPINEVASHIKSLKDVKVVSLTENPDWKELVRGEIGDGYIDVQKAKWICPISGMEMNGRFRFCCLWTCGCVFSEKALKEMVKVKEEGNECPNCQKPFKGLDIVLLNPTEDAEVESNKEKIINRRLETKRAKEAKKAGKKREASATVTSYAAGSGDAANSEGSDSSGSGNGSNVKGSEELSVSTTKKPKLVPLPRPPVAAAALSKVVGSTSTSSSNPKLAPSKVVSSTVTLAMDPNTSEVYKSLFTSHKDAQTQERAHWVTYNPFYN